MINPQGALRSLLASALLAAGLAGCGGGGDSVGTGQDDPATTVPAGATAPPKPAGAPAPAPARTAPAPNDVTAACTDCAAVDARTYAGAGVGIWKKTNSSGAMLDVPVSISGLSGQDVTLVFTNESATDAAFPAINNATQYGQDLLAQDLRTDLPATGAGDPQAAMREFNRKGWAERIAQARPDAAMMRNLASGAPQAATYAKGDTRSFFHDDNDSRAATLQAQATTTDGVKVNVWVETAEIGAAKVDAAAATGLATSFAVRGGIYDMLKAAGGPLWGPHTYSELIAGAGQPVDIVVLNFDRNQRPYGMVGYFWSVHNLAKAVDSRSNESVSLYLDAETLYLAGENGTKVARMTLAHEGMHMSNFYRRGVTMGQPYQYDTWLEEMTAMMMEDAAAASIDASYNPTRDVRLRDYLSYGSYNCALKNWTPFAGACESYSVSGSFGGFLLRQLGVGFFKDLLRQEQANSEAALDRAIGKARPGSGLGQELRHFAASAIPALPARAPTRFGFPARKEGGFDIPAIDASALKASRRLPLASPSSLLAYGNFPVLRRAVTGSFTEIVRVPAGTTLSVVIH